jgi:transcriptional regulator with XRE-family HTH domain
MDMKWTAQNRLSALAPVTAMVMTCLAPPEHDFSWGGSYERVIQKTANTAVVLPFVVPRTASDVRESPADRAADVSPWREPLNTLRDDLHATVSQLAKAIKVSRQSIHAWLRGEKSPSAKKQARISELQKAAIVLKAGLGEKLPIYLNYPLGEAGESFWDMVAMEVPAESAASSLVEAAIGSIARRKALDSALQNMLGEPLDR